MNDWNDVMSLHLFVAGMHIELVTEGLIKKMVAMLDSTIATEIKTALCVALFHFSVFHGMTACLVYCISCVDSPKEVLLKIGVNHFLQYVTAGTPEPSMCDNLSKLLLNLAFFSMTPSFCSFVIHAAR
jgi:hypothetical protein